MLYSETHPLGEGKKAQMTQEEKIDMVQYIRAGKLITSMLSSLPEPSFGEECIKAMNNNEALSDTDYKKVNTILAIIGYRPFSPVSS